MSPSAWRATAQWRSAIRPKNSVHTSKRKSRSGRRSSRRRARRPIERVHSVKKGSEMIKRQFMQPKDMWARVENGELLYVPVVTVHGTDHAHVYLAGQMARKVTGEIVTKGDMRAQIRTTCENIQKGLAYAGATFDDVVRAT